ncbi:MAG TPA: hypothetical protein VFA93_01780, partial [Patescibacteria group bacterium]|nr:hypothetical protein [Patescibacteria group bacterium]
AAWEPWLSEAKSEAERKNMNSAIEMGQAPGEFFARTEREDQRQGWFYLRSDDRKLLSSENPVRWLDQQFDVLYKYVKEGQELSSPVINNLEQVISEATRFIQHNNPESLDVFQTNFIVRLNLMTMRTMIGYRSVEQIKSAALRLTAHGLLLGFSMERGEAGVMFNRLNELLDDKRLKAPRNHVTPEMANELQETVIKEQMDLAEKGLGQFGDLSETVLKGKTDDEKKFLVEKIRANITRSVRIAYDLFVDSQRQAIIVARGKKLTDTDAYFSDPSSGPLNVYNIEDLLTEKFDIINAPEYEELDRIKLDLAEDYLKENKSKTELSHQQKIDLGTRLFRDLFAVPDFFSSGWRVKGILDSIEVRTKAVYGEKDGQVRAKEFGLFLRLRSEGTNVNKGNKEKMRAIWKDIAKFKPEEIVRLFRERATGSENLESKYKKLFSNSVFVRNKINSYDDFKAKYGVIIREIREKGFNELRQINIGAGLTGKESEMINRYVGEKGAGDVIRMFRLMSEFSDEAVEDLLTNNKFADIYTRTINVDDALLGLLEKSEMEIKTSDGQKIKKAGFVPLSQLWAADQGGDALVRNWNDTENAVKAGGQLIQFIKSEKRKEKLEHALNFADATSQYNGQAGGARVVRFTFGTFLNLSKKDYFWDVMGLKKGFLRKPISEIERIRGVSAEPLSRDELRHEIDEISSRLEANLSKKAREGLVTPRAYEEEKERARRALTDLENLTEVTAKDLFLKTALSMLIYIILASLFETGKTMGRAARQAA